MDMLIHILQGVGMAWLIVSSLVFVVGLSCRAEGSGVPGMLDVVMVSLFWPVYMLIYAWSEW